uniref:Uncharacterized protein n=1 Tax=Anopheles farauti TaxID=69004 RepID=A0A182QTQ8_9DIPT
MTVIWDSGDEELVPRLAGPCALPRSTAAAGGGAGGGGGAVAVATGGYPVGNNMSLNGRELVKQPQPTDYNQSVLTMQKSVTITVTPQRSNSMDLLNFEEKRQLIASSLSLSDILHVSPAAAHVAKEVAASTVIGKLRREERVYVGMCQQPVGHACTACVNVCIIRLKYIKLLLI